MVLLYFFLTYVIVKLHVEISIEQNMVKINLHTYSEVSRYSILIKTFYIFQRCVWFGEQSEPFSFTKFTNSRIIDSVKAINAEKNQTIKTSQIQQNVEDTITVIFKVVLIFL